MKRSTRSFASGSIGRVAAMQMQKKQQVIKAAISENQRKANKEGLRAPACLCCGNKNSESCNGCDA